uniref:Uncharacterized protein n=1 Tax=Physcomitrium patens TaxID=3218 RepID=A0A2K1L0J9_PHYPA|nr:hypothetical protein PHYPA_002338 [Physcomitrium patens]
MSTQLLRAQFTKTTFRVSSCNVASPSGVSLFLSMQPNVRQFWKSIERKENDHPLTFSSRLDDRKSPSQLPLSFSILCS